ncbi:sensor histidine kinase [Streptomyces sp. NPDC048411]|uniref:sensor histidine kinase n=1 Tax=Streptomyces sp. NPDC048411 TaxID=3157206 RepID=UPI003456BF12
MPRPPWLRRLPSGVGTAAAWCAAALFALVLFGTTAYQMGARLWPSRHSILPVLVLQAAMAVVMASPVGWARRRPLPVFGVVLAESAAAEMLTGKTWPFFLVMDCLVGYIAATGPRRTAFAAAAVELAAWPCQWVAVDQGRATFSDFLSMLSGLALTIAVSWLIGSSIRQQRDYGVALRAQAVTAERLRIARELHDMVAHSIGVIAIQAGAASLVIDTQPAGARKALDAIETTSRETLAGLRHMLVSLRRTEGDPATPSLGNRSGEPPSATGLDAVDRLAETTVGAGVRLDVHWRGERRPLPPEIDLAAFRIIQESVTNAVRHSGSNRCRVSVDYRDEELAIEVVDDGRGTVRTGAGGAAETGYGISGMRERVGLLNGRFSAGSRPEGGFRVAARLPI